MTKPATKTRSHRELIVWQRAIELIEEVYQVTERLPGKEMYGIIAQMRKAAVSIAANIAEGHGRRATRDYARFVSIANGSLREVQTYAEICVRLRYLSGAQLTRTIDLGEQVGKMLTKLREALLRSGARSEGNTPPDP
jgi:four helix bundle protein